MTKEQFYFRVFEAFLKIVGVLLSYSWGIMGIAVSIVITNTISKLLKIVFIASKIQITALETIIVIFKSWKFAFIVVPVCVCTNYFLPENIVGNLFLGIVYVVVVVSLFIFFPSLVGNVYANSEHPKLMSFLKNKMHKK